MHENLVEREPEAGSSSAELPDQAEPVTALPMPPVPGVKHEFLETRDLRIHYAERGSGPPLVLLHGWPQHWWCWRELIGPLSEHFRVICPDLRGFGWSEAPASGYELYQLRDDLLGLLDGLRIDRTSLVGHDWGSQVGYQVCLDSPGRIERYVAVAGAHPWTASGLPVKGYFRAWEVLINSSPVGPWAIRRLGVPELCLRDWRRRGRFTAEEVQIYLAPLFLPGSLRASKLRYRSFLLREAPAYIRHHKRYRLSVPTLHLNGELDPLTQHIPDSYRSFADQMELELVPDCGHFVAEERPDWFWKRLLRFLPTP
jgi:pimeloyl-ACP methyl ester carboxylesterase